MTSARFIQSLIDKGYAHYRFTPPNKTPEDFLVKGEYRVTIKWRTVTVEHCVYLGKIREEDGLIGPFRDGTYFNPRTGELTR